MTYEEMMNIKPAHSSHTRSKKTSNKQVNCSEVILKAPSRSHSEARTFALHSSRPSNVLAERTHVVSESLCYDA